MHSFEPFSHTDLNFTAVSTPMSQVSFAQLPDEIVEKIVDEMDVDSLKNFGLTSKRCASFLNSEKTGFKVVKDKVKKSLIKLRLSDEFKSLDDIDNFQQISSQPVEYAMSPSGFSHTILCLNHMKKIRKQHKKKHKQHKKLTSFCAHICRIMFFCLLMILGAVSTFAFVLCFATANERYYQYPEGKIVTKIPIVEEVEHAEEFEKEQRLYLEALFNGNEKKDDVWRKTVFFEEEKGKEKEEEEEEEEEEEKYRTESKTIFFLWHFISAAVCLSLSLAFLIFGGIIISEDDVPFSFSGPFLLLVLLLIPLLLPAVRMDELTKVTYWVFFIPPILGMAAVFVLVVVFQMEPKAFAFAIPGCFSISESEVDDDLCRSFRATVPLAYLLMLTGFVLFVVRIDNTDTLASNWLFHYTVIFAFPLSAVLLLLLNMGCVSTTCCPFLPLFVPLIVYGAFILPFCLRKDGIVTTSYHYVLIPWYLIGGGAVVVITGIMVYTTYEECGRTDLGNDTLLLEYSGGRNSNRLLREILLGERKLNEVTSDMLDN